MDPEVISANEEQLKVVLYFKKVVVGGNDKKNLKDHKVKILQ